MRALYYLAALFAFACTWEVGDLDMNTKPVPGDKRVLDPDQFGLLGQTLNVIADNTDGINKDPNNIMVAPVAATEAGGSFVQRTLNTSRKLNANNQYNPSIITLAIEATVTKRAPILSHTRSTNLQGVLKYGTGMANQGTQTGTPLPFANITLDPRIIFDIASGTFLSFPAAYVQVDLLYTAVADDTDTLEVGEPIGPNYQVVYSLGYEPQAHSGAVTMTQLAPEADLAAGDNIWFFRPKYATHVYFIWSDTTVTPLQVFFYNAEAQQVWAFTAYASATTGAPQMVPWPADAVAVNVSNATGSLMPFFKCVSILGL